MSSWWSALLPSKKRNSARTQPNYNQPGTSFTLPFFPSKNDLTETSSQNNNNNSSGDANHEPVLISLCCSIPTLSSPSYPNALAKFQNTRHFFVEHNCTVKETMQLFIKQNNLFEQHELMDSFIDSHTLCVLLNNNELVPLDKDNVLESYQLCEKDILYFKKNEQINPYSNADQSKRKWFHLECVIPGCYLDQGIQGLDQSRRDSTTSNSNNNNNNNNNNDDSNNNQTDQTDTINNQEKQNYETFSIEEIVKYICFNDIETHPPNENDTLKTKQNRIKNDLYIKNYQQEDSSVWQYRLIPDMEAAAHDSCTLSSSDSNDKKSVNPECCDVNTEEKKEVLDEETSLIKAKLDKLKHKSLEMKGIPLPADYLVGRTQFSPNRITSDHKISHGGDWKHTQISASWAKQEYPTGFFMINDCLSGLVQTKSSAGVKWGRIRVLIENIKVYKTIVFSKESTVGDVVRLLLNSMEQTQSQITAVNTNTSGTDRGSGLGVSLSVRRKEIKEEWTEYGIYTVDKHEANATSGWDSVGNGTVGTIVAGSPTKLRLSHGKKMNFYKIVRKEKEDTVFIFKKRKDLKLKTKEDGQDKNEKDSPYGSIIRSRRSSSFMGGLSQLYDNAVRWEDSYHHQHHQHRPQKKKDNNNPFAHFNININVNLNNTNNKDNNNNVNTNNNNNEDYNVKMNLEQQMEEEELMLKIVPKEWKWIVLYPEVGIYHEFKFKDLTKQTVKTALIAICTYFLSKVSSLTTLHLQTTPLSPKHIKSQIHKFSLYLPLPVNLYLTIPSLSLSSLYITLYRHNCFSSSDSNTTNPLINKYKSDNMLLVELHKTKQVRRAMAIEGYNNTIRVVMGHQDAMKILAFDPDMTIHELIEFIYKSLSVSPHYYSLYLVKNPVSIDSLLSKINNSPNTNESNTPNSNMDDHNISSNTSNNNNNTNNNQVTKERWILLSSESHPPPAKIKSLNIHYTDYLLLHTLPYLPPKDSSLHAQLPLLPSERLILTKPFTLYTSPSSPSLPIPGTLYITNYSLIFVPTSISSYSSSSTPRPFTSSSATEYSIKIPLSVINTVERCIWDYGQQGLFVRVGGTVYEDDYDYYNKYDSANKYDNSSSNADDDGGASNNAGTGTGGSDRVLGLLMTCKDIRTVVFGFPDVSGNNVGGNWYQQEKWGWWSNWAFRGSRPSKDSGGGAGGVSVEKIEEIVKGRAFPKRIADIFAFEHFRSVPNAASSASGWSVYSPVQEYRRLGKTLFF